MEKRRQPNNPFGGPQVIKKSDLRPRKSPRLKLAGLAAGSALLLYVYTRLTAAPSPAALAANAPAAGQTAPRQESEADRAAGRKEAEATSLTLIRHGRLLAPPEEPVSAPKAAPAPPVAPAPSADYVWQEAAATGVKQPAARIQKARLKPLRGLKVGRDFEATREGFPNFFRDAKAVQEPGARANDSAAR